MCDHSTGSPSAQQPDIRSKRVADWSNPAKVTGSTAFFSLFSQKGIYIDRSTIASLIYQEDWECTTVTT